MSDRFAGDLLAWFDRHGRHGLPWQITDASGARDAYRVWLSEVMLQQTQVATVVPYFERFVQALPDLRALAAADEDTVLALWSGLGYYRRARFLHQAARTCVERHGGELPREFDALAALPGIGRSTAGAILAQAHGLRFPILDGNVKRVLARHHAIDGDPAIAATQRLLWQLADQHTPGTRVADYTQAIMDLGATVCVRSRPLCDRCPVATGCAALRQGRTAELPRARPGKRLPVRSVLMLVVRDADGRVLLERRGTNGVWAGLWSLPEASGMDAAWDHVAGLARIGDAVALAPFVHVFSHYRLQVEPLLFDGATAAPRIADNPRLRWATAGELADIGLPAPVRALLLALPCPPEVTA